MTTELTTDSVLRQKRCPYPPAPGHSPESLAEPVARVRTPKGMEAWMVTGYTDAREIFGDPERFSARPNSIAHLVPHLDPESEVKEGQFNRMDGKAHFRFRRLVGTEMTRAKRMTELRPALRQLVDERVDELAKLDRSADLYADFAVPLTAGAIAAFLDIPLADRLLFQQAAQAQLNPLVDADGAAAAKGPLRKYIARLVEQRRTHPGDDPVSRLIARSDASSEPFTDWELNKLSFMLVTTGFFATAAILSECVLTLLRHPDELALLRADPSLVPSAVEELLRYLAAQPGLLRVATVDTEIAGCPIKAGDYVIVGAGAANFDADAFPDPARLDLARKSNQHLGFGYGPHQCIGHQLARLELAVAIAALVRRIPTLRLASTETPSRHTEGGIIPGPVSLSVNWNEILPATA
ncbi:MAG TPA: cytochrome P450 [Pseudonocardiaceae bacterium]|nr:cytochrome P450 [Pseudonocardiaceae bacterium]